MITPEQLADLEEIKLLRARYCRFLDTKQWQRLAALFTPDATVDGFNSAPPGADVAAFIAGLDRRLGRVLSIHHCHTPEIAFLTANHARGLWAMMDHLEFPSDAPPVEAPDGRGFRGWGYYEEEYRRGADGWRISFMRLTRLRIEALPVDHPSPRPVRLRPTLDWL